MAKVGENKIYENIIENVSDIISHLLLTRYNDEYTETAANNLQR